MQDEQHMNIQYTDEEYGRFYHEYQLHVQQWQMYKYHCENI